MSKIYEKRIKKGKGKQKKELIKIIEGFKRGLPSQIKPIIDLSLFLMILKE